MDALRSRARVARDWLFDHALPLWWERGYDREAQCFHERLALTGDPIAAEPRRVRVQARQTIVYALAGRMGWAGPWREAVRAGAELLLRRGLRPDGGTRHLLSAAGAPLDQRRDLYDAAFVLFALSEAARALNKPADIVAAADELGGWIHSHWGRPGGGFEEGEVSPAPPRRQNPHMHAFEAQLSAYEATGDALQLERATALARLFKEKLFDSKQSALPEYFDDQWRALSDEQGQVVEPGHHFEWSWLLRRWHSLGGGDLNAEAEGLRRFAEQYGVDASGAVYDELHLDGRPHRMTSRLWPHTERLKAALASYEAGGDDDAANAGAQTFDMLLNYLNTRMQGLWYDLRTPDASFVQEPAKASSFYHLATAIAELVRVSDKMGG